MSGFATTDIVRLWSTGVNCTDVIFWNVGDWKWLRGVQTTVTVHFVRTIPEVVIGHHLQHVTGFRKCSIIVFEHGRVDRSRQKNGGRRLSRCESQDVGRNRKYTYIRIRFRPLFPIVGHYLNRLGTLSASLPYSRMLYRFAVGILMIYVIVSEVLVLPVSWLPSWIFDTR